MTLACWRVWVALAEDGSLDDKHGTQPFDSSMADLGSAGKCPDPGGLQRWRLATCGLSGVLVLVCVSGEGFDARGGSPAGKLAPDFPDVEPRALGTLPSVLNTQR
jgi:hypothetical protein